MNYLAYSDYLKNKFGEKVYKIPIELPVTCPNRDGCVGIGGCTFCGEEGAGFELSNTFESIEQQFSRNSTYIGEKYHSSKYIGYLQNYSNTYMPYDDFVKVMETLEHLSIVGISISTRPDCLSTRLLDYLVAFKGRTGLDITLELGLQSINHRTLKTINRGHSLAEFIESALEIKSRKLGLGVHLVMNFPEDTDDDIIEAAKIVSVLKADEVKCHSLYILKDTPMGNDYLAGKVNIISKEAYYKRIGLFLQYLAPHIAIGRFFGRAPEERTLFCNWASSWRKLKDELDQYLIANTIKQGDLYHSYGMSHGLKRFEKE